MPARKTKLMREIAAQERRQEREAKRVARRRIRAERRDDRGPEHRGGSGSTAAPPAG